MRQNARRHSTAGVSVHDDATTHQEAGSLMRALWFRGDCDVTFDFDDQLVLVVALTNDFALEFARGGRRDRVIPQSGRFGLMTPGERFDIAIRGHAQSLETVLPRDLLADWLTEDHGVDGTRVEFRWGGT